MCLFYYINKKHSCLIRLHAFKWKNVCPAEHAMWVQLYFEVNAKANTVALKIEVLQTDFSLSNVNLCTDSDIQESKHRGAVAVK